MPNIPTNDPQRQSSNPDPIDSNAPLSTPDQDFSLAELSVSGNLNPLLVEHYGYISTGTTFARTDNSLNLANTLPIDDVHNWIGSTAQIDVWNISSLYVLNGTFAEGTPGFEIYPDGSPGDYPNGWTALSNDALGLETQYAYYTDTAPAYVSVENIGYVTNNPQHEYAHYAGSFVMYNQTIDITPDTEDFFLRFSYRYANGPLGTGFTGNASIHVEIDGVSVYNISLPTLPSRGVWYNTGEVPINFDVSSNPTSFSIGIVIDETMVVDADDDYDGDTFPDGELNTRYMKVDLDDVSLIRSVAPTPESVELKFNAGVDSASITGSSGSGSTSITNSSYWKTDPLNISITSNSTISFDYEAKLLSHRFTNSSYSSDTSKKGVLYSVNEGTRPVLRTYTDISFSGGYENLTVKIIYPSDWGNVTIVDPYEFDVTGLCTVNSSFLEIPESLLDRLGLWKIFMESPNYANELTTQRYDSVGELWENETIFRSMNTTRLSASIRTKQDVPSTNNVNMTWMLPNGTVWTTELVSSGLSKMNSSAWYLDSTNTTAGKWSVSVFWINGTEIAYGNAEFEIHHRTRIVAVPELIETNSGNIITGLVQFVDDETDEFLMDAPSNIAGNWSFSSILFSANLPENKWQANFDTSLVGIGEFVIIVNASRSYYDNSSCTIIVKVTARNNQLSLDQDSLEVDIGENITITLFFEDEFEVGIEGATINVSVSGPTEEITMDWLELTSGNYSASLSVFISGTYAITFSASKPYHATADDTLFLLVGAIGSNLEILNNTVDVIDFGESYRLAVHFENATGYSLEGATVRIADVSPENGLGVTNFTFSDESDGNYSIVLSPESTGTYIILIQANLTNHRTQFLTFTLTTTKISTVLTLELSDENINLNQNCTVSLLFVDEDLVGLGGATLYWVNEITEIQIVDYFDYGDGRYNLTVIPSEVGSFQVFIRAYLINHINATAGFPLNVDLVSTVLQFVGNDDSVLIEVSMSFELVALYQEVDDQGSLVGNISHADFDVTIISDNLEVLYFTISFVESYYSIVFKSYQTGTWDLVISATKDKYSAKAKSFRVTVSAINTEVNVETLDHVHVGTSYILDYHFTFAGNGTGIEGAFIIPQGDRPEWITWTDNGDGNYVVTLTPLRLGNNYSITLLFTLDGYETKSTILVFNVLEIEVEVNISTLSWGEGTPLQITLQLVDLESREPVEDSIVSYSLLSGSDVIVTGEFTEGDPGNYSTTIGAEFWVESNGLSIQITFDKEYYSFEDTDVQVIVQADVQARLTAFVTRNIVPVIGIVMLLAAALVSRKSYVKRNKARFISAQEIKLRFDDANNLLGVIVLHKTSGLPVYSRILKGGFEEGMISAFITAISHFRSEFDENGSEDVGKIIPISDIIRTVATKNLLCAFITVTNPSSTSETKMVEFSVSTRMLFDDSYDVAPTEYRNEHVDQSFNRLFERHLDSALLQDYKLCDDCAIPKEFKHAAEIISDIALKGTFKLTTLALALAMMDGIHEAFAYQKVAQVQESEIIIPIASDYSSLPESESFPWKKDPLDETPEE